MNWSVTKGLEQREIFTILLRQNYSFVCLFGRFAVLAIILPRQRHFFFKFSNLCPSEISYLPELPLFWDCQEWIIQSTITLFQWFLSYKLSLKRLTKKGDANNARAMNIENVSYKDEQVSLFCNAIQYWSLVLYCNTASSFDNF